jgi:hypothetical protein
MIHRPRPPLFTRSSTLALLTLLGLAACAPEVEAPTDRGVCWRMITPKGGKPKFLKLTENQSDLEHCAANLEAVRIKIRSMGGTIDEVDGAYQGEFIFIDKHGVFVAPSLNATPFPALVRTGDGRLGIPGSAPQP